MPELPEVENVRRVLDAQLPGQRIIDVRGAAIQMRRPLDPQQLGERLRGKRVAAARRRGKYLLVDFEEADTGSLLAHLGMSGRMRICAPDTERLKHTHLTVALSSGLELRFIDPRRFGFAVLLEPGGEASDASLAKLGLDPLAPSFAERLPDRIRASRAPMKSQLMDQRCVAGLGNIYVAEALWRARIRPLRAGHRVSTTRLKTLAGAIQDILRAAIEAGGTTLRDYGKPDGQPGEFALQLEVYGREGQPCIACEKPLHGEAIAGRATVWCKQCQR